MSKEPISFTESENNLSYEQINRNIIKKSDKADTINDRYVVNCLEPTENINNIFCNSYSAKDLTNNDRKIYALIYNKSLPLRLSVIYHLKYNAINNIVGPIDYGITYITEKKEERFVVIFEEPNAITIQEYISNQGVFNVGSIIDGIIIPVCNILNKLNNFDIVHGSINHNNVYINPENKNIILGNCIGGSAGFAQKMIYEPLERVESNPSMIKGEGDSSIDYYALGVLCLYSLLGDQFSSAPKDEELLNQRFNHGSYKTYVNGYNIPTSLRALLKGLLSDDPGDRWQFNEIMDWYSRKQQGILENKDNFQSHHNIMFNNNYYPNVRALAYNMSKNWELAKTFIKEEYIIKWLDNEYGNIISTKFAKLFKPKLYNTSVDKDELLIKALCILDQNVPIRLKECSVTLDALGLLMAYGLSEKLHNYIDYARRILNLSLWHEIIELDYTKERSRYLLIHLSRAKHAINKNSIGFGIERSIYELNPQLPCQSPNLRKEYIMSVPELLICLDKEANNKETFFIDRHITAFLGTKLMIDQELNYKHYNQVSKKFLDHDAVASLILVTVAQQKYNVGPLNNLALMFVEMLAPALNMINNHKRKQDLHDNLNNNATSGDLSKLLKTMSDPAYLDRDQQEMKLAKEQLFMIDKRVRELQNFKQRYKLGYSFGLKLCVMLSYLICSALLIALIITKF